jgi:hypothetical protein
MQGGGAAASTRAVSPAGLPKLSRFEVLRTVGEGGTGLVFEAIDRERGVRVALKMLRLLDGDTLFHLKEEFRALQDIEHPNLLRLYELMCDEGTWFITMELVIGTSFLAFVSGGTEPMSVRPSRAVSRSGAQRTRPPAPIPPIDETRLRGSLAQLARGLEALHAAGKVHRDIKPSNLLVAHDGRVVILDFGLVRDAAAAPSADDEVVVGTISYMAPEQAAADEITASADWYAVGAVLYQCLTGRAPFEGPAEEVLRRKQREDPAPPSVINPRVPPDLDVLCMELLARDPAARPSAEEVLRRLEPASRDSFSDRPSMPSVPPAPSRFVGRTAEEEVLAEAFDRVHDGEAATVVVVGESGVGKSALVRHFVKWLPEDAPDVVVLSGRCYEREDVPYKAIDGVIDALSHYASSLPAARVSAIFPPSSFVLAHAFPVLRRVPHIELGPPPDAFGLQEGRSLLFAALRDVLTRLALSRPLVVVIDDLQWADADSLALLADLMRPPAPPLLLIATARASREPRAGGAPFGLSGWVRLLPLERLTRDEGLELATALLGTRGDASVAGAIAREADGHPLFLDELVRHAVLEGGPAPANVHLDEALVARVGRLEPAARGLLELLAVAGVALPQSTAMRAAKLDFDPFTTHARTLRAAHLARTDGWRGGDAIEPYHDRVREAVAARLDDDARRRCHRALAIALESAEPPDADALSTHWLAAGDDAKAGAYARTAAEQAFAALAFERAAELYERALAKAPLDEPARQALRIRLAESLANGGRCGEAGRAFFVAAEHAEPSRALDLRRRAAEALLTGGRWAEGEGVLRAVLAAVGLRLPNAPIVALIGLLFFRLCLWLRGLAYRERSAATISPHALTRLDACAGVGRILSVVDTIGGAYFQTRALLQALKLGEPHRLSHALAVEGVYVASGGPRNTARSERHLVQAEAIARRTASPQALALVHVATGYARFCAGRLREAREECDRGATQLREECPAAFWDTRTAQMGAIWAVGWMGDLRELSERVERGVREAEHGGDLYATATLRTGIPNLTWLRRGDPAEARAIVVDATREWTSRSYHNQHYWSLLALTQIDLYEGHGRAAHARVTREWGRIQRALILQIKMIAVEAIHLRARTAIAAANEQAGTARDALLRAAERDARTLTRFDWSIARPFAEIVRAGVASSHGDVDTAAARLRSASEGFDEVAMALHATSARWQLGRLLGGDEGAVLRKSAEAWMEASGVASPARMVAMMAPGFERRS